MQLHCIAQIPSKIHNLYLSEHKSICIGKKMTTDLPGANCSRRGGIDKKYCLTFLTSVAAGVRCGWGFSLAIVVSMSVFSCPAGVRCQPGVVPLPPQHLPHLWEWFACNSSVYKEMCALQWAPVFRAVWRQLPLNVSQVSESLTWETISSIQLKVLSGCILYILEPFYRLFDLWLKSLF